MSENKLTIGIGEFVVSSSCVLEAIGLGSCVAVCLYDKGKKLGGIAHIMLGKSEGFDVNPMRFADKAIDAMLKELLKKGCKQNNLTAKIFGGASMFSNIKTSMEIGNNNVNAVKAILKKYGIKIIAEDTGGTHGRSVWFDLDNGKVVVSKVYGPTIEV
ncbi:MAG: chemotaxis protein CheD [Candidatus Aenigmarchaeota archaeon]|nr:chemotaxis protein CheD [Candidatus Aenigmarchaeota archaeon]